MPSMSRIDLGGVAAAVAPLVTTPSGDVSEGGLPGPSLIIWFKLLCDPLANRNASR